GERRSGREQRLRGLQPPRGRQVRDEGNNQSNLSLRDKQHLNFQTRELKSLGRPGLVRVSFCIERNWVCGSKILTKSSKIRSAISTGTTKERTRNIGMPLCRMSRWTSTGMMSLNEAVAEKIVALHEGWLMGGLLIYRPGEPLSVTLRLLVSQSQSIDWELDYDLLS